MTTNSTRIASISIFELSACALLLTAASSPAGAVEILANRRVEVVYAQAIPPSTAHMVQLTFSVEPSVCRPNGTLRAYIEPSDAQLFSAALAHHITGQVVGVVIETQAPPRSVAGIEISQCRLISIF